MTPSDLTDRERQVARLVAEGATTKQIAAACDQISERRVRVIVSAIAFKIGADAARDERVQVALWWTAHSVEVKPAA